ncbi:hypothetical protein KKA15_02220 [Patescibacteria group bacterium]|nr:hypothetical protein [Patescibacteria group bacterium]
MKEAHSLKVGLCFGLTSAVITTLGLMVGLSAGTHSKLVVIGGILTIAVADAFSDALGIHVAEESENKHTTKEIWQSTVATFLAKFIFALTFIVPVIIFSLNLAIIISIFWGIFILSILSYYIARQQNKNAFKIIFEHVAITIVVIIITNYVGVIVDKIFS